MNKILVIPLEVKNREIAGACKLATIFLKNQWTIFLGQKQQIFPYINQFSKSLWFLKSIVPGEISLLKKIKKNNNIIATLDVEGLITHNGEFGVTSRFGADTIGISDYIFFWGKSYASRVKKYFNIKKKFYSTGSPIADTWINKEIRKSKKEKKILVATSFTLANSIKPDDHIKLMLDNCGNLSQKKNEKYSNYLKKFMLMYDVGFKEYIKILPKIFNKYKNYKFIIRPHPAEDQVFWKKFCKKFRNVSFDKNSSINESLKNTKYFLHYNSTGCFNAEINDIRSVMFFPKKKYPELFNILSDEIKFTSKVITDEKKFINFMDNVSKKKNTTFFLENFKKQHDSSKLIFDVLKKSIKSEFYSDPFNLNAYVYFFIYELKNFIARILGFLGVRRFNSAKFRDKKVAYYKWSNLSQKELIKYFKDVNNKKFDVKNLQIKKHFFGMYKLKYNKK